MHFRARPQQEIIDGWCRRQMGKAQNVRTNYSISVKYPSAAPPGTFSRGKELPHRQASHDV